MEMLLIYHYYLLYLTPSGLNQNRWKQLPQVYLLLTPLKAVCGPRPNTKGADFNFEAEIQCLSFKLNLGKEANMNHVQQDWFMFIDLIYDHPEVFSLHDEDRGIFDFDQTYNTNDYR